ncbi:MAG: HPr family phosphocarrier protein [Lachnospiraceae bacterium]|nr:HPr family phosphocarrier protein [Lachnospiraceae bacterium]
MISRKATVKNRNGLHIKPAAALCAEAVKYKCLITFSFDTVTANAKSLLSILGACVHSGEVIDIVCDGEDEREALNHMCRIVEEGLGE